MQLGKNILTKYVVERYLVYLFDNLSKIDLSNSESLENLMPWLD
jgi:hypothetical protein